MVYAIKTLDLKLRQSGCSITKPRRLVFMALLDQEPLSMGELVLATNGKLNRATLYRVIELFEKLDIVQRLQMGWKYKLELSDSFTSHHHHITCSRCNTTRSFDESTLFSNELAQIASNMGFKATSHQLELQGICSSCQ